MTDTVIRASSTSGYVDCGLRTAARIIPDEFEAMGFKLRTLPQNIGAVIGTATHVAIYSPLKIKADTGTLGDEREAQERGLESLAENTAAGVMWDELTATLNAAQKQVIRLSHIYRVNISEKLMPVLVEERMESRTDSGLIVSGQIDVYADGETLLGDAKTGKMQRWNAPQYGTYSRLLRTQGWPVEKIEEHYVPRVRLDQEQPPPKIVSIDVGVAERASASIIKRIERDLAAFRETGNPDAFIANPMSMLCGDRFCPAHSTALCRYHKGAKAA